jgi:hypothetical protein
LDGKQSGLIRRPDPRETKKQGQNKGNNREQQNGIEQKNRAITYALHNLIIAIFMGKLVVWAEAFWEGKVRSVGIVSLRRGGKERGRAPPFTMKTVCPWCT